MNARLGALSAFLKVLFVEGDTPRKASVQGLLINCVLNVLI